MEISIKHKAGEEINLTIEREYNSIKIGLLNDNELKQVRNVINNYLRSQSNPEARSEEEIILSGINERFKDVFNANPRIGALQQGDVDKIQDFIKNEIVMERQSVQLEMNKRFEEISESFKRSMKNSHILNNKIKNMENQKDRKKQTDNPLKIWRFDTAPDIYKSLSINGGDEDWLVLIPLQVVSQYIIEYKDDEDGSMKYNIPNWMEKLGACDVDIFKHVDGIIVIGSHS